MYQNVVTNVIILLCTVPVNPLPPPYQFATHSCIVVLNYILTTWYIFFLFLYSFTARSTSWVPHTRDNACWVLYLLCSPYWSVCYFSLLQVSNTMHKVMLMAWDNNMHNKISWLFDVIVDIAVVVIVLSRKIPYITLPHQVKTQYLQILPSDIQFLVTPLLW